MYVKHPPSTGTLSRRGAMLPLIAILLPVLLLLVGFAVDLAYMQNVRQELRAATDVTARAAANELARTDKTTQAIKAAKDIAGENLVAGQPLVIESGNIVFGRSEPDANGKYIFQPNASKPNAAQVTGFRFDGIGSGGVPLFFGRLYGRLTFEPSQISVATFLNVDICLVLDQSTSMKQDIGSSETGMYTTDPRFCQPPGPNTLWVALDGAVHVFTDVLRDTNADEKVAVVSYNSSQKTEKTKYCGGSNSAARMEINLSDNLDLIDSKIETMTSTVWNGNTNIEAGIREGLAELQSPRIRKYSDKVMILLTDGTETTGSALAAATDCAAAGVVVHTITFGDYASQSAMQAVAAATGGEQHHAADQAELEEVFRNLAAWYARLTQ
jgi:Ca-activated chloride channel homolog